MIYGVRLMRNLFMVRAMMRIWAAVFCGVLLLGVGMGFGAGVAAGQSKNPCDVITKAEAEAVVGVKLEGPQLSPRGTQCKFTEPGYGDSDALYAGDDDEYFGAGVGVCEEAEGLLQLGG